MPDVVTLGEAMALFVTEPPVPLRAARTFHRSIAGAESNVAIGVCRLGASAGWIGRVGDDAFGHAILDTLRGEGVDLTGARVDDAAPTGLLIRDRHPQRRIEVIYHRAGSAGSRLGPEDVDPGYVADARVVHITGITMALSTTASAAVWAAVEAARAGGTTVSFDPNLRRKLWDGEAAAAALEPLARHADLVHVGLDEGEALSGRRGKDAVAAWYLERGASLVTIKQGADGAWATDGQRSWSAERFAVTPVDAVGAGDAFAAGFLAGHLRGEPVDACLRLAGAAGALAVQVPGDIEGLPYARDVDALLAAGPDIDR